MTFVAPNFDPPTHRHPEGPAASAELAVAGLPAPQLAAPDNKDAFVSSSFRIFPNSLAVASRCLLFMILHRKIGFFK